MVLDHYQSRTFVPLFSNFGQACSGAVLQDVPPLNVDDLSDPLKLRFDIIFEFLVLSAFLNKLCSPTLIIVWSEIFFKLNSVVMFPALTRSILILTI